MGITLDTASRAQYESAIRKLFPQGDYWDEQFADTESDVSIFAKAKLDELVRFRDRMSDLLDESRIETTDELIADWERVLLGDVTYGKTLTERRLFLKLKEDNGLNRIELQKIADVYGLTILSITFPYGPAFFGHARFNTSFLGGPAAFSALLITAFWDRKKFWNLFTADHAIQQFGTMRFGRDRLAWFPIGRLYYYLGKAMRAASMGLFKLGTQRLFPVCDSDLEQKIIQENKFFLRFEKAFINYIVREKQLFQDFEVAIQNKLLANQIPSFNYEGE
jgi:hypothetical protein